MAEPASNARKTATTNAVETGFRVWRTPVMIRVYVDIS